MKKKNVSPHQYRPDIDGLRAIAVLSVVAYHAFPGWLKGGFVGVDIFFVISGYLISRIIFSELNNNHFSFIDFYSRRIKRIFPALSLVMLTFMVIGWYVLLKDEYRQLGKHTAAGAAFISNLVLWNESDYFDSEAISKPLLHLWSLGVEEQFYILWPLVVWFVYRVRWSCIYTVVIVAVVSFVLNISTTQSDPVAAFYSPQTRFWELLLGSFLGWISLKRERRVQIATQYPSHMFSLVGGVLLILSLLVISEKSLFPGWMVCIPVVGAALLIAAGPNAWFNRMVLSRPILVWIGLISFPLYLWHWPLLSFSFIIENEIPSRLSRLLLVAISIALAGMTYYWIEKPIRQSKKSRRLILALVWMMMGLGAVGFYVYKNNGIENRAVVELNILPTDGVTYRQNPSVPCVDTYTNPIVAALCIKYVAPEAKKTIVLWGDSSAGAWLPVFLDLAAKNNISLLRIMHLSCPPILDARKTRFNFEESRKYCSDGHTQRDVLAFIREIQPDVTVVIAAWNAYSDYSQREFITDTALQDANAQSTKRVITERLPETLLELTDISKTIVFESWPILNASPKARKLLFSSQDARIVGIKKEEFEKDVSNIKLVMSQAQTLVKKHDLILFDPAKKICLQNECLSRVDGVNYYLDKYHITPKGSVEFAAEIEELIK